MLTIIYSYGTPIVPNDNEMELVREKLHQVKEGAQQAEDLLNRGYKHEAKGFFTRLGEMFGVTHDKPGEKISEGREYVKEKGQEAATTVTGTATIWGDKMKELFEGGKEKAEEMKENVYKQAEEGKGMVGHAADYLKDKISEGKDKILEQTQHMKEGAADTLHHVKESVGLEETQKGFFARAKDKVVGLWRQEEPKSEMEKLRDAVEQKSEEIKEKMQSLTGYSRKDQNVMEELRNKYEEARNDLIHKAQQMYDYMAQEHKPEKTSAFTRAKDDVLDKFNAWVHEIETKARSIQHRISRSVIPSAENAFLIQSTRFENGVTMTYINDNGEESLDIIGDHVDPKFDALSTLNGFRQEFELPPTSSLANVSVEVHQLGRPNVTIKSSRIENDIVYDYKYHDGKETLNVTFVGRGKSPVPHEDVKVLNNFRQTFGISIPQTGTPKIGTQQKSEL
jgi:hypothetical protein